MRGFEAGVLQSLDPLIPRQVKHEQLCVSRVQAPVREVDVLLLRLDVTEGEELRQLSSSSHEGVSTITEVVVEDAVKEGVMSQRLLRCMGSRQAYFRVLIV